MFIFMFLYTYIRAQIIINWLYPSLSHLRLFFFFFYIFTTDWVFESLFLFFSFLASRRTEYPEEDKATFFSTDLGKSALILSFAKLNSKNNNLSTCLGIWVRLK